MTLRHSDIVIIRGAGDLATGVIVRLVRSGYRVAALEVPHPTAIRRTVSLSEAVREGSAEVEGVRALLVQGALDVPAVCAEGAVPILVDPSCASLQALKPRALVDAILAKRNLGTELSMAPVVVALGPGFEAGVEAHAVVETNRGHDLGRVILLGRAEANTGVPGVVGGFGAERVYHAPDAGVLRVARGIGDSVAEGQTLFSVEKPGGGTEAVASRFSGIVRGMLPDGFPLQAGLKTADVDARARRENCFTVSDKSRSIGGGVLEALLRFGVRPL